MRTLKNHNKTFNRKTENELKAEAEYPHPLAHLSITVTIDSEPAKFFVVFNYFIYHGYTNQMTPLKKTFYK